jgi:hypothetical protein
MLQVKYISKGELVPAPADGYWKSTNSFSKPLNCFSIEDVKLNYLDLKFEHNC